jgi:hypothetical protein
MNKFVDIGALIHQGLVWGTLLLLVLVSFGFIFQLGVEEECTDLDFSLKSNLVCLLYIHVFWFFLYVHKRSQTELHKYNFCRLLCFKGSKHRITYRAARRLVSKGEKEWLMCGRRGCRLFSS